jgi:glucan 1,3-beta-glucosidase
MVGEVWSVLMGSGSAFQDASNPVPVFKVGNPGDAGVLEITDLIFTVRGPAPGAVIMEWNVRDAAGKKGTVGIWDSHIRVGGFAGTNLEADKCPSMVDTVNDQCRAAFLGMHVTKQASMFASNVWIWVADHDLDYGSKQQINIYNGRGWLVEAEQGPVWMYGTSSEHSILYQYNFQNSKNCLVALPQTETPYMQGTGFPTATSVEPRNSAYNDPGFSCNPSTDTSCNKAWSTVVSNSSNIYFYGMGAYSFFDNYSQDCLNDSTCQRNIVDFLTPGANNYIYNLNTVGASVMVVKDGEDMVPATPLRRGFTSTLAAWRP